MNPEFWRNKRVLVTGHTGFKGSWLALWLESLGAKVSGFALEPPTEPSLFELAGLADTIDSTIADIRDRNAVSDVIARVDPEIVIHMAAQPIVRTSHIEPVETYDTNIMGTVHLLDAVRGSKSVKAVVCITSDKCYQNNEWDWGYREDDRLGGKDPYSSSKACAEIVIAAMGRSFFNPDNYADHGVAIASVRAGNVIGGGDWAADRLIPDTMRAFMDGKAVVIRNPISTRPWQHVLEPLHGYLTVAERLWNHGPEYAKAWNFGPAEDDAKPVQWIVDKATQLWGQDASWHLDEAVNLKEDTFLQLDCSRAHKHLGWQPVLRLDSALDWIVEWFKAYRDGENVGTVTLAQIARYEKLLAADQTGSERL